MAAPPPLTSGRTRATARSGRIGQGPECQQRHLGILPSAHTSTYVTRVPMLGSEHPQPQPLASTLFICLLVMFDHIKKAAP